MTLCDFHCNRLGLIKVNQNRNYNMSDDVI